jgi:anti-sigma B factor antagonist
MDLDLGQRDIRGVAVLSATGELDVSTSALLQPALWKLIDDHVGQTVLLDLRGIASIDHLGIGIVVGGLARAVRHGGDLALVCGPSRVLDLLTTSRLDRAFIIHPSLSEATVGLR